MSKYTQNKKSLTWKSDKKVNNLSEWIDYGIIKRNNNTFADYLENQFTEIIKYKLYNDIKNNIIILEDVDNGLRFILPNDTKTRGYVLAYKLYNKES